MTDRTQFEAMLEALINEDQETAKEIFHNIVVAKSREIYEELLESDFMESEVPVAVDDGGEAPAEMPVAEESDEEEDDSEDDSEDDGEVGGDAGDDFVSDVDGEEDGESEDDGAIEDRVMDLEDALDELKAEFEQLMAGEEGEEHDMGGDDMGGDDEFGAEPEMDGGDELDAMMEYVDKVALPKHGDNGANAKSVVAGKNDMGGTSANIAKSFSTEKGGTQGGLAKPTTTTQDAGNINKPGANAGKTAFKKKEPGHGAEKKGSGDTAPDRKSLIGSRK
jgi:hypothetical protein